MERKPILLPNGVCGVYMIENIITRKVYVGSSKNIKERFSNHRHSLNRGNHENRYLQGAWNKYGPNAFTFSVIATCEEQQRFEVEQHFIDLYNACDIKYGYNLAETTGQPPNTPESRQRQAESLKKNTAFMEQTSQFMKDLHADPEMQRRIVDGVRSSEKVKEARKRLNESEAHKQQVQELLRTIHADPRIQHHIKTLAQRNMKNPSWRAKKLFPVIQLQMDGTPVRMYESLTEAARHGFDRSTLAHVCEGKYKQHKGYKWVYSKDFQRTPIILD